MQELITQKLNLAQTAFHQQYYATSIKEYREALALLENIVIDDFIRDVIADVNIKLATAYKTRNEPDDNLRAFEALNRAINILCAKTNPAIEDQPKIENYRYQINNLVARMQPSHITFLKPTGKPQNAKPNHPNQPTTGQTPASRK